MLAPWLELPGVDAQLGVYSELIKLDLVRLGTTADATEIVDTAITQPLIVATGLVAAGQLNIGEVVVAGHSIGEVTAAGVAGALTAEAAMTFAARRGAAMAQACEAVPTSMAALMGGEPDEVVAAIIARGLTPANRNGAGQIVAAGSAEGITGLVAKPPAGVRVVALKVAGAFHTSYMSSAEQQLRSVAAELTPADPAQILLSNADGTAVADGRSVLARLVAQVTRPVRWDLCLNTLRALRVLGSVELTPAKTLTGITKRELPGIELVALRTPDDLAAAQSLLDSASSDVPPGPGADGQLVSTPSKGIFTRAQGLTEGDSVVGGSRIGTIRTDRDELAIVAPASGLLAQWLKGDGDIVSAGLPVARVTDGVRG